MNTFTLKIEETNQIEVIQAFLTALKIKFTIAEQKQPYKQEFVTSILKAEKQIKNGQSKTLSSTEFDGLWK